MPTGTLPTDPRTYAAAVATTAIQSALTGAWVAAAELRPGRRRLARAGVAAAVVAHGFATTRSAATPAAACSPASGPGSTAAARSEPPSDADEPTAADPAGAGVPGAAVLAAGVSMSVALLVGSKRLQKRWLDRLGRGGHPHPHRGLALRLAALTFVGSLPGEIAVQTGRRRRRSS